MVETTRKLIEEVRELMDSTVKQMSSLVLSNMGEEEILTYQKTLKAFDTSTKLMEEHAAMLETIDKKLDALYATVLSRKES